MVRRAPARLLAYEPAADRSELSTDHGGDTRSATAHSVEAKPALEIEPAPIPEEARERHAALLRLAKETRRFAREVVAASRARRADANRSLEACRERLRELAFDLTAPDGAPAKTTDS